MSIISKSLFLVVVFLGLASAAYIRRDEFTKGSNCASTDRFKSAYYLVATCTPPANVLYSYYKGADRPIQVQYFSDDKCSTGGGNPSTFIEGACEAGTSTDYSHTYLESLPALEAGLTTYAIHDRSKSACTGDLQYLVQHTSECYYNADGSFQSARTVCSGTRQTLTKCTDLACSVGCTTSSSDLTNACSVQDHDVNSCGAPSTINGGSNGSGNNSGSNSGNNSGSNSGNNGGNTTSTNTNTNTNSGPNSPANSNDATGLSSLYALVAACVFALALAL